MEGRKEIINLEPKIAYFSMEMGLEPEIPTYSGGLGVLAGDTLRSGADLNIPLVGVTLVSRKGYFRQAIDSRGNQIEYPGEWRPEDFMERVPNRVKVRIEGREVWVQAWKYEVRSAAGGEAPVFFLDTDLKENSPSDREITHYLYGGDEAYRLKQEIVLGVGGARMLRDLGIPVRKYHMNEGHSSLLTLELLCLTQRDIEEVWDEQLVWDEEAVRKVCVFTTHTSVEAGHDKFQYDLVENVMGEIVPLNPLKEWAGSDHLNMSRLALSLSGYINGVAPRHGETSQKMFPGFEIHAISNGVHSYTWTCESFRELYNRHIPGWANEPQFLVRVDIVPDREIWGAHQEAKKELLAEVNRRSASGMEEDVLTIGFARRATDYKRADLLFSDIERLIRVQDKGPIQVIYAGKAHPRDLPGKRLIERIFSSMAALRGKIRVAYLEDYGMVLAKKMVSGVDVWLNTPLRPLEASGTSGMKAAHNGILNFSVLDGWWVEGHIEGITGWSIGPAHSSGNFQKEEIEDLYGKLREVIVPLYYRDRKAWIHMMKNAISKNASYFNSHRMMRCYVTEAYLR
jgi:starch phosphorylase